tara:strand:- start:276 stop:728 length:453 start_codon:yes stop_codon:yes gene_type:complete
VATVGGNVSKVGRRSKLTREVQDRIVKGLKLGLTYEHAAAYAGIDRATLYRWLARGRRDADNGEKSIFSEFCDAIKESEGLAAAQCMARIVKAAEGGTWQASAWILERRFGYRQHQEVSINVDEEESLEEVEKLIERVSVAAQSLKPPEE